MAEARRVREEALAAERRAYAEEMAKLTEMVSDLEAKHDATIDEMLRRLTEGAGGDAGEVEDYDEDAAHETFSRMFESLSDTLSRGCFGTWGENTVARGLCGRPDCL